MFAFAANTVVSRGVKEGVEKNPTFAAFIANGGRATNTQSIRRRPRNTTPSSDQISKVV